MPKIYHFCCMKSSLEIAQEATMRPIIDIAEKVGFKEDDVELFGKSIAKISLSPERKKEISKLKKVIADVKNKMGIKVTIDKLTTTRNPNGADWEKAIGQLKENNWHDF